jgi:hypothetical protein
MKGLDWSSRILRTRTMKLLLRSAMLDDVIKDEGLCRLHYFLRTLNNNVSVNNVIDMLRK